MVCQKNGVNILERRELSVANKNPNTSRIVELAQKKTSNTEKKVLETIKAMLKQKKAINFNSVSYESKVSKSFLYKNLSIRNKINMLRTEQQGLKNIANHKPNTSDKSKDVIIEALKNKILKLEKENKELKECLAVKYTEFYDEI